MKYQDILSECDELCEGANYHSMTSLATDMFEDLKPYIAKANYEKVAKIISAQIVNIL